MKFVVFAVSIAMYAPAVPAALGCETLLTPAQKRSLAGSQDARTSVEIFHYEAKGQTRIVALVGEKATFAMLSEPNGPKLYDAFDHVGFSFRPKYQIRDRYFKRLIAQAAEAAIRVHALLQLKGHAEFAANVRRALGFVQDPKVTRETDLGTPSKSRAWDLVNNPFFEVESGVLSEGQRPDLPDFLRTAHRYSPRLKTFDLERGYVPGLNAQIADYAPSLNIAIAAGVAGLSPLAPTLAQPLGSLWLAAFAWQLTAFVFNSENARPWFRKVFPFMHLEDYSRNSSAAHNILEMLARDDAGDLVVIVDQRRVADLRQKLTSAGFELVASDRTSQP